MGRPGLSLQRRLARRRQEARAEPNRDAPAPGFWHRFDAGFARARSLAVSIAVLLVLGVVGWSVIQELNRDPVIIEPLTVPESLAKAGWTGEVLARQIRDGVREINKSVEAKAPTYLFEREQIDVVLPGASISIRTLVAVVRGVLDRPARRIAGEVIERADRERLAGCKEASPAGSRYLLVGRLNNGTRGPWNVCAESVDDLPQEVAKELVRATTPLIYAFYQYQRDPEQAKKLAEAILADKEARTDHALALILVGIVLESKGSLAMQLKYSKRRCTVTRTTSMPTTTGESP